MTHRDLLVAGSLAGALTLGAISFGACSHRTTASPNGLSELEQDTGVTWVAIPDPQFGTTFHLFPNSSPPVTLTAGADPSTTAMAFVAKYGEIFSMSDPANDLVPRSAGRTSNLAFASFNQTAMGTIVDGGRLTVVFDPAGRIAFVTGLFVPNLLGLSTKAALTSAQAEAKAQADMTTRYSASQLATLEATAAPQLVIYPFQGTPALAYQMVVAYTGTTAPDTPASESTVMRYVIDANTGTILEAVSGIEYQNKGTNVVQITASGKGEGSSHNFTALATTGDAGKATAPYYLQVNGPLDVTGNSIEPKFTFSIWSLPVLPVPPLTSTTPASFDTSSPEGNYNPGSGVDAYFYLNVVDRWWQLHGRNGYDNRGGQLGIEVHDFNMPDNSAWTPCLNWIDVGITKTGTPVGKAQSIDVGIMAHEFQHGVNHYAFGAGASTAVMTDAGLVCPGGLDSTGEPGAINESLGDIFGQFIAHDMGYQANCIHGVIWNPGKGVRNLVDPHESPTPQPDNVTDPRFYGGTANDIFIHQNNGVANKAWSLTTFGGQDKTGPKIKVSLALALGWSDSEQLYLDLVASQALDPHATFVHLAWELDGVATLAFGHKSTQENAVACAWYAVGVLSAHDLQFNAGIDPCACAAPDAGTCDAGTDASADGSPPQPAPGVCVGTLNAQVFECITYPQATVLPDCVADVNGTGAVGALAATCPSAGQPLGCCAATSGDMSTACYFATGNTDPHGNNTIADQQMGVELLCSIAGGVWTGNSGGPSGSDSGTGSGNDAGAPPDAGRPHDGGADAGSGPPHC